MKDGSQTSHARHASFTCFCVIGLLLTALDKPEAAPAYSMLNSEKNTLLFRRLEAEPGGDIKSL